MALSSAKIVGKSLVGSSFGLLKHYNFSGNRFLFTKNALGVTAYEESRAVHKKQFKSMEDTFRKRLSMFVDNPNGIIFSEDLKALLHLVENNQEDLTLVSKMLKQFNAQKQNLRFSNFTFGPVVMRMLYSMNLPDLALELFKDPEMDEFFAQMTTIHVLMHLLWINNRYQDCIDTFNFYLKKPVASVIFPRNSTIIASAACYKLNTPESLKTALDLVSLIIKKLGDCPRRSIYLTAALALNQKRPDVAMEIISANNRRHYNSYNAIILVAYAQAKRFDDVLNTLRNITNADRPMPNRPLFFADTIEQIETAVKEENLPEDSELVKMLKFVKESGLVKEETLDHFLTQDVPDKNLLGKRNLIGGQINTNFNRGFNSRDRFDMTN